MMPVSLRISPLLRGALLLLLLAPAGCSVLLPDSDFRVTLVNGTERPLIYSAMTSEAATRVYLPYAVAVSGDTRQSDTFLEPGESATLTREEIQGGDETEESFVFVLYEVSGDTATWKGTLSATRKELEQLHFRLEVTQLPLYTALQIEGRTPTR